MDTGTQQGYNLKTDKHERKKTLPVTWEMNKAKPNI